MSIRYLTGGESHGQALVGIIDGIPSGLVVTPEQLNEQLRRRKKGHGRGFRQKIEKDLIEILSGVRHGQTLGSPISLLIHNNDWISWKQTMSVSAVEDDPNPRVVHVPRPGHADLVGGIKYKHDDLRNVLERASARETTMRVAVASIARVFLSELDISVASHVVQIGSVKSEKTYYNSTFEEILLADESTVRCLNAADEAKMIAEIDQCIADKDTVGGVVEVVARGVPLGLGSYCQWDRRLDAKIAASMAGLNAVKAVEFGLGIELASLRGSAAHDEYSKVERKNKIQFNSNRAGGIIAGMSTGQDLVVRATIKPIPTLMKPLGSVDINTFEETSAHVERSDYCVVPAAAVIAESLLCLVITEMLLEKFGGDSMPEIKDRVSKWRNECTVV